MLRKHLGIVSVVTVLLLSSCMLFQSPAEISVMDQEGNKYLLKITVDGRESYIKDGKILINLPDGVYTAKIPGMRVFKDEYELKIKNGKGIIVLEKSNTGGANILTKSDGRRILVVSGMGNYKGFEVRFVTEKNVSGGNTFEGDGKILIISSPKAFAMVSIEDKGTLGDWIVESARVEWKDVESLRIFDGENVETIF